jgi:membrane peptidoglycan carboxypeptidase
VKVLTPSSAGKTGAIGRLVMLSLAGGALLAGLALPVVAGVGLTVRSASDKFRTMSTPELGQMPVRSEILDRQGHLLAYYYPRGINRVPVSYSQISPYARQAIVAIEDSRFWQHGAIDFRGTIRALLNNLRHQPIQGGSTLAQQYVKNVLILSAPNPQQAFATAAEDTVGRKIRELQMAMKVEHSMTKDQILTGYLNAAYYDNQSYGIEVAAQRYFSTHAADLTLTQAAMLAGMVENPSRYDPLMNPQHALDRRNTVLARMAQVHDITQAQATQAQKQPLGLKPTVPEMGCTSHSAKTAPFFCDYVLAVMQHDSAFKTAWKRLNGAGGLTIYTTLDRQDQTAAQNAVDYEMPPPPSPSMNPAGNADVEVLVQPGTGQVRAMAQNRAYGTGPHQTTVNYAVGPQYDGSTYGMQIGSTGKVYTMVAALQQGIPFGYSMNTPYSTTVTGYTNCQGGPVGDWKVHNDESEKGGTYTLYTGTTLSINVFFAYLEKKVGLCNVVKTASQMGLTWPDGRSLLQPDPTQGLSSADNISSFTLGSANVAPIDVAAADATLPARGIYCHPIVVTKIVTVNGGRLPVESAGCRRALDSRIADAANYILKGDLTGLGTAASDSIGRPAASKTGTADSYASAFFVGYTPDLLGAVGVYNPGPKQVYMDTGYSSCYRDGGCPGPGFMYGSMAPGKTWQRTFEAARLDPAAPDFVSLDPADPLFSMGNGMSVSKPKRSGNGGNGNGGFGFGGGNGGGLGGGIVPPNIIPTGLPTRG